MPSAAYSPGLPQAESDQPYTKWDADKDEVEVDYKQMNGSGGGSGCRKGRGRWFSGPKGVMLKVLLVIVIFMFGLIVGYVLRRSLHKDAMPNFCPGYDEGHEQYTHVISHTVQGFIERPNIEKNLRSYSSQVHMTGTKGNNQLRDTLMRQMGEYNLEMRRSTYNVLISYANWTHLNTVFLLSENNSVVFQTHYRGKTSANMHPDIADPFHAFSPSGDVTGELVYANYGEEADFNLLKKGNVTCQGNIVIMRYGKIYRGRKVTNAANCGAVGVILYSDPGDVTQTSFTPNATYPNSWGLPGWGVQRGSVLPSLQGDPLTPGIPSIEDMYRIPMSEASFPKIPSLPIGYSNARELLNNMKGPMESTFHGAFAGNVTYRMGPGYQAPHEDWKVRLVVNSGFDRRDITNVFGILRGEQEPDRYIIVGCHYDAWTTGATDPNVGTAILMELAKIFAKMKEISGWRPRRTIIFAHWDAEEQGLMGSYEWVEEHAKELAERTVMYINLDSCVQGNHTLRLLLTPLLQQLTFNVTKMMGQSLSGSEPGMSLYDVLAKRSADPKEPHKPRTELVGSGSDQAPFLLMLGTPVLWPRAWWDEEKTKFSNAPSYHTAADTFDYHTRFLDPGFHAAETVTRLVAEVVLQASTHTKLLLDIRALDKLLHEEIDSLRSTLMGSFTLDPLLYAVGNFSEKVELFYGSFAEVDIKDVLKTRMYNDRLMQVSRAFIHPAGLPGRPNTRNILFAPSVSNEYSGSTFSGITDAFRDFQQALPRDTETARGKVQKQISIAVMAVESASHLLRDDIIS